MVVVEKATARVLHGTLKVAGQYVGPGSQVELPAAEAERLRAMGLVEILPAPAPAPEAPEGDALSGDALLVDVGANTLPAAAGAEGDLDHDPTDV